MLGKPAREHPSGVAVAAFAFAQDRNHAASIMSTTMCIEVRPVLSRRAWRVPFRPDISDWRPSWGAAAKPAARYDLIRKSRRRVHRREWRPGAGCALKETSPVKGGQGVISGGLAASRH